MTCGLFNRVWPLHRLYSDIEDVGILRDELVRQKLLKKYDDLRRIKQEKLIIDIASEDGNLNKELYNTYKNFNVMSNGPKNQVAQLVYGFLKCPLRKDTSDESLKSLANNSIKDRRRKDILLGILEVRKLRKTIGTYLESELSADGRIHTQCNINGTESGRTSTGILKPPVSISKEGIALQTMTKHQDMTLDAGGGDLRSMFIADSGFSFIEPDLSQAEDRVVCVLAKDWQALKDYERTEFIYNNHGVKDDRHTKTAVDVCGLAFEAITDFERQVGKKTRHSGNYKVGKHQHMLTLAKSGIFVSEWTAGKQLERFNAANPQIVGVFHTEIIKFLQNNDCILTTPHGRVRQFFNKWGDELFKEAFAQIPQATVSDQTKFAMVEIAKHPAYMKEFAFVLESHDSFLMLCKDELIPEMLPLIKFHLEQPIPFKDCSLSRDYDLVIPCEIKVGKRWIEKSKDFPDGMEKMKL